MLNPSDSDSYKPGLGPKAKIHWANIANNALSQGQDQSQAVTMANNATRDAIARRLLKPSVQAGVPS